MIRTERRRAPRRQPDEREPACRVRLRAGRELQVVNASSSGLWVEGAARLLPGTHVDVHVFTAAGRILTRTRVARACVAALSADAVLYRAGLCFERPLDLGPLGYQLPAAAGASPGPEGRLYPEVPATAAAVSRIPSADEAAAPRRDMANRLIEAWLTVTSGADDDIR